MEETKHEVDYYQEYESYIKEQNEGYSDGGEDDYEQGLYDQDQGDNQDFEGDEPQEGEENNPEDEDLGEEKDYDPENIPGSMTWKPKWEQKNPGPSTGPVTVLMVAEKPSIAKSIAEALGGGRVRSKKGVSRFCPVLEYSGTMFGRSANFKVTSVAGHVYTTDFPRKYQDWKSIDPLQLFAAETVKKEANPKSRLCRHLQSLGKNVTYLVLWLDNDKEGENICFEVMDNVKPFMYKEKYQQIYRAKFSSIVHQDLQAAFHAIRDEPNYNESISVDARQIIDLKIGVAFSRFQTLYFTTKYPQLNAKLISYGPCQTPTLGFCVARHFEIENFKPKTFYRVVPTIVANEKMLELDWDAQKTFNQVPPIL